MDFVIVNESIMNTIQTKQQDRSDWIVLQKEFSGLGYAMSMSPHRLAATTESQGAAARLGLQIQNTAIDTLEREFVGGMTPEESIKLNLEMENGTMSQIELLWGLELLWKGSRGEIEVKTRGGRKLSSGYLKEIYDDMTMQKGIARAEWVGTAYVNNGVMLLGSHHIFEEGLLKPQVTREVGKKADANNRSISIESLFNTKTENGLPTPKTEEGDLTYYYPTQAGLSWTLFGVDVRLYLNGRYRSSDHSKVVGSRPIKRG